MKFGPVPLRDAEGAILAHGVRVEGHRLPKAHRVTAADIAALQAAGVNGDRRRAARTWRPFRGRGGRAAGRGT